MSLIVLLGETASGKSSLALELAERIDGEIINADALQIYKDIPIATAQPYKEDKQKVPHHLYGFLALDEEYNIALYQLDARKVIEEITSRGKTPIMVGGSGLYIRAALYDYQFPKTEKLSEEMLAKSTDELFKELQKVDEVTAAKLDCHNRIRIIRALELYYSGNPKSQTNLVGKSFPLYDCKFFYLKRPREVIYERINARVDELVKAGLLEEVETAIKKYDATAPGLKAIGVKELLPYFKGEGKSLDLCLEEIKKDTRNYAKRQSTFIRHQFIYEEISSIDEILRFIK